MTLWHNQFQKENSQRIERDFVVVKMIVIYNSWKKHLFEIFCRFDRVTRRIISFDLTFKNKNSAWIGMKFIVIKSLVITVAKIVCNFQHLHERWSWNTCDKCFQNNYVLGASYTKKLQEKQKVFYIHSFLIWK